MRRERVRTKHGFKGLGKFFLGCFIGFISAILTVVGLGYWVYSSFTVRKLEKLTKTDITRNKGVEDLTIKKVIGIAKGISQNNPDSYTIAKFEEDFNITLIDDKDAPFGVDMSIIKNSPIKDISKAFDDTIDTITFNNVLKFLDVKDTDIGMLNNALEKTTTYYIYNGKLYTNQQHTIEVGFNYTVEGSIVKLANGSHTIKSNTITPRLMDLPLNVAITKFSDTTESLKIYEILDYKYDEEGDKYYEYYEDGLYFGEVSGVMNAIADYTIDDLSNQDKINELTICEVLGYYYNEEDKSYYTSSDFDEDTKVAGVMNALAGKNLEDLSNQETIEDLYIYQVMNYYKKADDTYYTKSDFSASSKVEGIMATIAGKTIDQLDDDGAFNDVLVADAMGYKVDKAQGKVFERDGTTLVTGVVKHLALMDSTISSIAADVKTLEISQILDVTPGDANNSSIINALCDKKATIDNIDQKIKEITLGEMVGAKPQGDPANSSIINALYGSTIETLNADINDLTLGKALGKTYEESTGVLKTFHGTKISKLAEEIEDIKIWQAVGYYEKEGKYYTDSNHSTPVTGIMGTLAGNKVSDLSSSTTFETLHVYEIMGYTRTGTEGNYSYTQGTGADAKAVEGVMVLLAGSTIRDIPQTVEEIINNNTIYDLINKKIIVIGNDVTLDSATTEFFKNYTIPGLVKFINDNIGVLGALSR